MNVRGKRHHSRKQKCEKKRKTGKSRRIVATHNVFDSWATIGSKKINGGVGRRSR